MLRSSSIVVIYFMFISRTVVYCQSVDYILQKISSDSRPNEQPLLLLGRKQSRVAIPQFSNNIPQVAFKYNEELVISCPEKSDPEETRSAVGSLEATSSAENLRRTSASLEETRIDQTTAVETEVTTNVGTSHTNLESIVETEDDGFGKATSTSTFDSVPHSNVPSIPRPSEIPEESDRQEHVQATVSKRKGKFYATDINFPWELPYLKCERPAHAFVRKVNKTKGKKNEIEPCEDNGGKYEIGFWVKGHKSFVSTITDAFRLGKKRKSHKKAYEWHPLITVCFNMHEWRPVYTKHTLYGSAIKAAAKLMLRPNNFDYEEIFRPYDRMDPSLFYDKVTQYRFFVSMFGHDIAFTYNDTVSKFLIPLQLVDPAEMPTPLSTLTTYSYMATTPSWEAVALRNWRILTKAVLSFADENQLELVIYSGTANILQLQAVDGELKNIRFEYHGNTLAVSKILYKLVHNELSNEAIIFFVYNNPYVNDINDSSNQICVDVCESSGWDNELWRNLDRGFTTCCKYEEVKNTFTSLPQLKVDNLNLLKNNRRRTEPALTEPNEMDESAFTETSEVMGRTSTSFFRQQSSASHEVTVV